VPLSVPGDAEVRGEIQAWAWNIAAASLEKLVPAFNEKYPDVDVNVVISGTNVQSRLLLSLSAGVGAPDVCSLQSVEAPFYARTGRMTDLTPVAAKYEKEFAPAFWQNCVYDGRIYGVPWDMGPCGVFYKRRLFDKYGVDPDAIETWADYIAAGKRILERSRGKTKMLFLSTGQLDGMFEIILQQVGGQLFDPEGRVVVDSKPVRQTMDVLHDLLEAGIGANDPLWSHSYFASFKTDAVATYPIAAWFGGSIKDHAPETSGEWGVFRLPAVVPGGLRTSNYGGSVLVIPDQSANKAAAWKFIEYALCTREAQLEQYRNFDLFPALLATHSDPFFDEPLEFFGGQRVRQLFRQDIERIPPLNRTKDWNEALRYLRQVLSEWVSSGLGDPEAVIEQLEHRLSTRLGRPVAGDDG
jgi:ABC-type glycerol-3-phosphate transport system substrate-binding protein